MAESPSSDAPSLPGLAVEVVEWLPSGAESGLVRVRGRWIDDASREDGLPALAMHGRGTEHRFESLPDARFSRDPASWRGTYLVPAELVASGPDALWLEWDSGARARLPALARGADPPSVTALPEPEEPGGQVIGRAVLAEHRARRAEAGEQAAARRAAEALKAVEVLELRSAELERRLDEAVAERDALDARGSGSRAALSAALASAAALRSRSREWQIRLRTNEVSRAGDAVRLAVLEAAHHDAAGELDAVRRDAADREAGLEAARREAADRAVALDAAHATAAAARAERDRAGARLEEVRVAWDRRREELESALAGVRAELGLAYAEVESSRAIEGRLQSAETALAAADARLRVEAVARTTLEDELDRARAARAERDAEAAAATDLRREVEAARDERDDERRAADDLRRALEAARAALDAAPGMVAGLRSELEAERAARRAAEQALEAAQQAGASLTERVAELESRAAAGPQQLERLAGQQAVATAAHQPPADAGRLVADLDAAAEALRRRPAPPASDAEPAAPDAEPSIEAIETRTREPLAAPSPPPEEPATPAPPAPMSVFLPPIAPSFAPPVAEAVAPEAAGPVVVPSSKPPARALMVGTGRREYPLLRGAIVKLAHDDPALAGRLLAALLPAQGAAIDGPLGYDLTIAGTGTFAVAIAGGRATAERIERPRPRVEAEFHLSGDPLLLAELLAGVEHRIGRFFGPVRVRGRKRRLKALRALPASTAALTHAAGACARLDPELVYRTFAYAVHPSWTRGHSFTIAQAITGEPAETWYLTARDGGGVIVSATGAEPDATVSMSRAVFDRLLRAEPVPSGERPVVRGDRDAVALMRSWTERAQRAN